MEAKFIICVFKMLGLVFFFLSFFFFIYRSSSPPRHQLKPPDRQQQEKEVEESKVAAAVLRLEKKRKKKKNLQAAADLWIKLSNWLFILSFFQYFLKFNATLPPAAYFAYLWLKAKQEV